VINPGINPGNSIISSMGGVGKGYGYFKAIGGNSGCVISPAPTLGLSAYQSPDTPIPLKEDVNAHQSWQ